MSCPVNPLIAGRLSHRGAACLPETRADDIRYAGRYWSVGPVDDGTGA